MSVAQVRTPRRLTRAEEGEAKVSPLELFFDLVFVFALTQVTAFMADDPTFASMGRSVLVLALIWWAWSGYAWLTSTVDPEQVLPRIVMFGAMGAMLVVALAVPGAFGADGEIWAAGYLAVRVLHAALFYVAARGAGDTALARNVVLLMLSLLPGGGLVLLGALAFEGGTRDVLWIAAVILDYGIVVGFADPSGWKVHAEHFAERFALVMIIAFGESIVAIGIGAEDVALEAAEIVSALVGIAIVCLLWWAYFDVYALVAGRRLREAVGADKIRVARDAYTLLHFPMITGVVFFALGVKKVLEHPGDPLKDMPAVALCGGLALYALAHVAFRLRNTGTLAVPRVIAAAACLAVIPLATSGAALTALVVLAVIWLVLVAYETLWFGDVRAQVRGGEAHP